MFSPGFVHSHDVPTIGWNAAPVLAFQAIADVFGNVTLTRNSPD
jgi:hypothetical protein